MLDSHCHLDDARLAEDRAGWLEAARRAGVTGWLVPGVDPGQQGTARQLCHEVRGIRRAAGLHPWVAAELEDQPLEVALRTLEESLEGACALGECGLDRSRARNPEQRRRQEAAFVAQLRLAGSRKLPLIVHVVRTHGRALELLERSPPPAGGIVHAWTGPAELIPRYAQVGLAFGVGFGLLRQPEERVGTVLHAIPRNRLVLETDAPDQPRKPGQLNPPAALPEIAAGVASRLGRTVEDIATTSDANLQRLLGDWPR